MLQCTRILFSLNKGKVLQVSGKQYGWDQCLSRERFTILLSIGGNISRVLHSSIHNSSVNSIHNTFVDRGIFTTVFTTVLYCQWGDLHNSIVLTLVLSSTVAFLRSGSSWSRCERADRKPGDICGYISSGSVLGVGYGLTIVWECVWHCDCDWMFKNHPSPKEEVKRCEERFNVETGDSPVSTLNWRLFIQRRGKMAETRLVINWEKAAFIVHMKKCYPCF